MVHPWGGPHHKLQGWGRPSVLHAVVVIFLEFFAWGLLTVPVVNVMARAFPSYTFLMNGMIQGVKVRYCLSCPVDEYTMNLHYFITNLVKYHLIYMALLKLLSYLPAIHPDLLKELSPSANIIALR